MLVLGRCFGSAIRDVKKNYKYQQNEQTASIKIKICCVNKTIDCHQLTSLVIPGRAELRTMPVIQVTDCMYSVQHPKQPGWPRTLTPLKPRRYARDHHRPSTAHRSGSDRPNHGRTSCQLFEHHASYQMHCDSIGKQLKITKEKKTKRKSEKGHRVVRPLVCYLHAEEKGNGSRSDTEISDRL